MASNLYRKMRHSEKDWLVESPFICLPKGTKRWIKKYLSRHERRTEKQNMRKNDADQT